MGSLSDFSELELLDHVFNAAYSPVATVYLALATADPTDAGTGASMSECASANGYTRKAIAFAAAADRAIAQDGAVTFDVASGSWGAQVSHWAIVDSGTHGAGNMLAHGVFVEQKVIANGNTPSVASGEVVISFSAGELSTYLAHKLLELMFKNTAYAKPATWVAFATSAIEDTDDGSAMDEVSTSGTAYARVQVNINGGSSPTWDLAASGVVDNTHAVTFPTATASWGTITSVAIMDSTTEDAGNVLFYDNAIADQAVGTGDTCSFAIGALDIEMS
jgi:hypothetical protein